MPYPIAQILLRSAAIGAAGYVYNHMKSKYYCDAYPSNYEIKDNFSFEASDQDVILQAFGNMGIDLNRTQVKFKADYSYNSAYVSTYPKPNGQRVVLFNKPLMPPDFFRANFPYTQKRGLSEGEERMRFFYALGAHEAGHLLKKHSAFQYSFSPFIASALALGAKQAFRVSMPASIAIFGLAYLSTFTAKSYIDEIDADRMSARKLGTAEDLIEIFSAYDKMHPRKMNFWVPIPNLTLHPTPSFATRISFLKRLQKTEVGKGSYEVVNDDHALEDDATEKVGTTPTQSL